MVLFNIKISFMKMKIYILFVLFACIKILNAQTNWHITGNAGTNPSTNFIGTTDAQPLVFKINNTKAGYLDYSSTQANTAFGYQTLLNNTTGYDNIAIGYQTLYTQTSGFLNIAVGWKALYSNTSGSNCTAIGYSALYSNTTGYNNTALGQNTLYANTTAISNTAVGNNVLFTNTTGTRNTGLGESALFLSTTSSDNTASGYYSLYSNTTGSSNTAYGTQSLSKNTSGSYNVSYGYQSLYNNTTTSNLTALGFKALYSNTSGTGNVALGYQALYSNTTATSNTAIGYQSLYFNTGDGNTATGYNALYSNTTGIQNTSYGYNALYANTTGYGNTSIGYSAGGTGVNNTALGNIALADNNGGSFNTAAGYYTMGSNLTGDDNTAYGSYALYFNHAGSTLTGVGFGADINSYLNTFNNSSAFGNTATITASNQVRVGNSSVTSIGGYANWTNISDGRVKKNIKGNVPGLKFINKLKPITYNLDLNAADKIIQRPPIKDKNGKIMEPSQDELKSKERKQQIVYTGFVAQDVEKAAKSINYDFSGIDIPKNDKDLYGLRYSDFVVPLVKAVQELSKMNDDKDSEIADLQKQINDLKAIVTGTQNNASAISLSNAFLGQNIPNPFSHDTKIFYTLPQQYGSAQIIVIGKDGKVLKQINISGNGKSSLNIDASTLSNGAYSYSLYVNGKLVDTKQMILTR